MRILLSYIHINKVVKIISLSVFATLLIACSKDDKKQEMPPPAVAAIKVEPVTFDLSNALTGRLEASRKAEVRARVPGILQKRLFEEGSTVKEGQRLFLIDDASLQAIVAKAKANLAKAEADMKRMRPLMLANAISKQQYDAIVQAYELAKADLKTAQINLGYAHVTAPISGRISRSYVTEGALVGQGDVTLLAVIQQNNPLYVNLTQSAAEMMKLQKMIHEGTIATQEGKATVQIALEDGTIYPHVGKLLFIDPTVDERTGQVSLRAEVPNPDGVLLPGLFVKVLINQAKVDNVVVMPKQAVSRGSKGDTVMVINADGSFEPKPVTILQEDGQNWLIKDGLKKGDVVMLEGTMKLMMGAKKVKPEFGSKQSEKPIQSSQQNPVSSQQSPASSQQNPAVESNTANK